MNRLSTLLLALFVVALLCPGAYATNGDNLIGVGPISRSMGGVGIAAPQDAISAVFSNPAGMCFGPYCPGSEFNFAGTLFMPDVETRVVSGGTTVRAESDDKVYAIPAIGLSWPVTEALRFGLAAYGVSGLGVDYRDTDIENPDFYNFGPFGTAPLASGTTTQLQIMKFSPNLAYQVNEDFSVGLGLHVDYSALDLGEGSSFNYGYGVQLGALYKLGDYVSLGATYRTPQSVDHKNVADFDQDGEADDLELGSPQELGLGVAVEPLPGKLLFELDGKWVNWADADGYEDFDWDNQTVVAVGAQFKPVEKLALRLGYNYGENPVEDHDNWDGAITPAGPNDSVTVQGKTIPRYYYETFRIIGFPAIVEHHVTVGIGYEFSKDFAVNIGYMHAFEETVTEQGTDPFGQPAVVESSLEEQSIDFGLTWRF